MGHNHFNTLLRRQIIRDIVILILSTATIGLIAYLALGVHR